MKSIKIEDLTVAIQNIDSKILTHSFGKLIRDAFCYKVICNVCGIRFISAPQFVDSISWMYEGIKFYSLISGIRTCNEKLVESVLK